MSPVNDPGVRLSDPQYDVQGRYIGPEWAVRDGWRLRPPTKKEREGR